MTTTRTTRTLKQVAAVLAATFGLFTAAGTAHATPASTGDDPEAVAEIMRTAQTLGQEFPILNGTTISTAWLAPGVYAQTSSQGIALNKRYTTDLPLWRTDYQADVASGFHPKGCDAPAGIVVHEAAHVIDIRTNKRAEEILLQQLADGTIPSGGLSGYSYSAGAVNPPEALAEALTATYCGANATPSETAIYQILVSVGR